MSADENPKVEVVVSDKSGGSRNMTPIYMAVIAIVFLAIGFFARGSMTGAVIADQNSAAAKAISYINANLVQAGDSVSLVGVSDAGSFYLLNISYRDQKITSYVSKDGKYLIPAAGYVLDMDKPLPETETESQQPTEVPKSDKPSVELFVMSFCPYGVQAEQAMAPVVDLFGSKADIKVRFIAGIGDTIDSVQSLHGPVEGKEDIRQLCIAKNYDTTAYWKYLAELNDKCYPIYRNGDAAYDACWKTAAENAGMDTAKIDSCITSEGVSLLKAEVTAADGYGASGSPTLIINGVMYNGARTPEAFKTAICNAFNTAPSECGQTLSAAGSTTASGGCA